MCQSCPKNTQHGEPALTSLLLLRSKVVVECVVRAIRAVVESVSESEGLHKRKKNQRGVKTIYIILDRAYLGHSRNVGVQSSEFRGYALGGFPPAVGVAGGIGVDHARGGAVGSLTHSVSVESGIRG